MKKKSIFNASFEESLNLEDDGFLKLQQDQHDKTAKYFKGGRTSMWFIIRSLIVALICPIGFNFSMLVVSMMFHDSQTLTIPIAESPSLTVSIYLILLLIWLLLVVIGKFVKRMYLFPYRYQFHAFTFMNWFALEFNLVFNDFLLPALSFSGVIAVYTFIGFLGYFMITIEIGNLRKLMYRKVSAPRLVDKIANKIAIYGMGVLSLGVIVNFILKGVGMKFSTLMSALGFLLTWFVGNIVIMAITIFIGFPYFLQAYYKWKYPEEYREWEGKTLEEWYGKRYLKKHKELLENE
ncbi:hypothetical protein HO520_10655 [Streptococcus suis]|nr:hypothetical protein [Streptococcus suis]